MAIHEQPNASFLLLRDWRFSMNAIRQIHESLAEMIQVPEEFRHRKTEVIFIAIEDSDSQADQTLLSRLYGAIPDFPNRDAQGDFESRLEMN